MDVTNLLNIHALDFYIWGFHIKATLMMSIIILIVIAVCWLWNRRRVLNLQNLVENRKKSTWCQACDVDMILNGTTTKEYSTGSRTYPVYKCPKCQLQRLGK